MTQRADFHLEGGRDSVLLIHGLTGTPSEMRLLGKGLNRAGFTVHGVQLAGHCGDMEQLLATDWQDWYDSVELAARRLRDHSDRVFVAGLSMGALLALLLAAEQPSWISGVGVLGATFRYDGWNMPHIGKLSFLLPLVKRLGLGRNRVFMEEAPYGIRDEKMREYVSAAMLGGDSSAAGLPGNPWHSLAELYLLSAHVRKRLSDVHAPCLIAHAVEDDVAHIRNARLVATGVSGPVEWLLMKDSYHMITIDRERRLLIERLGAFFGGIAGNAKASQNAHPLTPLQA